MKMGIFRAGLCLFVITGTSAVRAADQPAPTSAPATTNGIGPRIQFDSLNYEFGTVRAGTKVRHDFVFTNTGDATLEIKGVQPGCHCTTVGDWTHQVEPGKTGVIPIQFDSTGMGGQIYRAPTVTCNDKHQQTVRIQLHGMISKPVDFSPSYVFMNIGPDASQETNGVIHITNNEDQPLLLAQPTSSQPAFTAELRTNIPGKSYDVIIKTVPPLEPGNNQAVITVAPLSNTVPPIYVTAMANVLPVVAVMPPEIALPAGPLNTNKTITVSLRNTGSHPLVLSEPSVNAAGATVSIGVSRPGQMFTASVDFPTGFAAPAGTRLELSIKTDNAHEPVVKIPIRQAPALRVAPPLAQAKQ